MRSLLMLITLFFLGAGISNADELFDRKQALFGFGAGYSRGYFESRKIFLDTSYYALCSGDKAGATAKYMMRMSRRFQANVNELKSSLAGLDQSSQAAALNAFSRGHTAGATMAMEDTSKLVQAARGGYRPDPDVLRSELADRTQQNVTVEAGRLGLSEDDAVKVVTNLDLD